MDETVGDGKSSINGKYAWKINQFNLLNTHVGKKYFSPMFTIFGHPWRLMMEPGGCDAKHINWVSLFLQNMSSVPVTVKFRLELAYPSTGYTKKHYTIPAKIISSNEFRGISKFIERSNIAEYPLLYLGKNESLHVRCVLYPEELQPLSIHEKSAVSDFGNILQSGQLNDITLLVDETKIPAHRMMLAARSPYFMAMFSHEMKENMEGVVKLDDVNLNAMQHVLRFIYTGSCGFHNPTDTLIFDVLSAADRFQIKDLRQECVNKIVDMISVDNALDVLMMSDVLHLPDVKVRVMNWICAEQNTLADVMHNDAFKKLNMEQVQQLLLQVAGSSKKRPLEIATEVPKPVAKKHKSLDDDDE